MAVERCYLVFDFIIIFCLLDIESVTSSSMYVRRKDVKLKEKEEILILQILQCNVDSLRDDTNHCLLKRKGNKEADVCLFPYILI